MTDQANCQRCDNVHGEDFANKDFAYVSLVRLGGCNFRMPVEYRGKSVYVKDPQMDVTYRLNAAKFLAGEGQYRDSWGIRMWDGHAAARMESEKNWQT